MPGQTRKETAWKKSRKFGDVKGGRMRPKLDIFHLPNSLMPPAPGQDVPIVLRENPSRDFYFPVEPEEVLAALDRLPADQTDGLTHIWFRRIRKKDWLNRSKPLAQFICGRGVRVIVLYPWPVDRKMSFGKTKPKGKAYNMLKRWSDEPFFEGGKWWLSWSEEGVKQFYIEGLLLHEVGHHVDWYWRHWSKANWRVMEEFAYQYAVEWSASDTFIWNADED